MACVVQGRMDIDGGTWRERRRGVGAGCDGVGDVQPGRAAASGPGFPRLRSGLRRPQARDRLDTRDIGRPKGDDLFAQLGVVAVSGILEGTIPSTTSVSTAARTCSRAIAGLVAKPTSVGKPAWLRRIGSAAQSLNG